MKLTMLGTGNATVTECYNTCFVLEEDSQYFMIDGGGGNTILGQLKKADVDWQCINDIFVTHKHIDHIMGIVWLVRMATQGMSRGGYDGELRIYGHKEVMELLEHMCVTLLGEKEASFIGKRVHMNVVEDKQVCNIIGHDVTFFDIHSTKAKQFGFSMQLENGEKLTCCGDEPYNDTEQEYVSNCKWLMHEAFCLYSQAEQFKPYEKHHSTVKDACQLAEQMNVENLILYHTEDKNIKRRKQLYTEEGQAYYTGKLYVLDDLESLSL